MIGRRAGSVSPSMGPRPSRSTCRSESSGSSVSTGSSSRSLHSSTRSMAPTATTGLVIEAMRKMLSLCTGSASPRVRQPATPTSLSPRAASRRRLPRCPCPRGRPSRREGGRARQDRIQSCRYDSLRVSNSSVERLRTSWCSHTYIPRPAPRRPERDESRRLVDHTVRGEPSAFERACVPVPLTGEHMFV